MDDAGRLRGEAARTNVIPFRDPKKATREIVIALPDFGDVSAWVDDGRHIVDVTTSLPRWRIEGGRRVMLQPTARSILRNTDPTSQSIVAAVRRTFAGSTSASVRGV